MSSLASISTKGGAGKSTLAVQLAIAAQDQGRRSLIIDCDGGQNSIHVWATVLRNTLLPEVRTGSHETIEKQLASAIDEGFDFVIVDVPPSGGQMVARIASLVDHILVPVRATTFDLLAMGNTIDLLETTVDNTLPRSLAHRNALGKAAVVLNGIPTRPSASWRADIIGALDQCGAGDLKIIGELADRAAYSASLESGRGVVEERRDRKAREEILELYRNVDALMRRRRAAVKKAGGKK